MPWNSRSPWPRSGLTPLLSLAILLLVALKSLPGRGDDDSRVAYLIQVGESNMNLFPRMLIALYHPRNHYALY